MASLEPDTAAEAASRKLETFPQYPSELEGSGVVVCGGGEMYFPAAWVCISMLRHLGCGLPIQLWYLGRSEVSARMARAVNSELDVECVDATDVVGAHSKAPIGGWELKPYAIVHSRFRRVLLVDADNVPVQNPERLLESDEFEEHGAVFWPDVLRLSDARRIWIVCGVQYRDEPEFESGQLLVDKKRCWQALQLTMWYNENSSFFYQYMHGDKETFHMAFRRTETEFSMPPYPVHVEDGVYYQFDFDGEVMWQHRIGDKWRYRGDNRMIPGFRFDRRCRTDLARLRRVWNGRVE